MNKIMSLIFCLLIVLGICGWVSNAVKLASSNFEAPYKNEVIRTVGVFVAPIGSIAGFVEIKD